jgi:transposase
MDLLNLCGWEILEIDESQSHIFIRARYKPATETSCPECSKKEPFPCQLTQKYGVRIKSIKDAPVRGKRVSILLAVQKYKCQICGEIFADKVPEIQENSRLTKRLIFYVLSQSMKRSFSSVAEETGISESTVSELFDDFVKKKKETRILIAPEVLGVDDVYIGRVARCILTDIVNRKVIDILPKRDIPTVYEYLIQIKKKENVKVVTMDMCRRFYSTVKDAFREAEVVIDTFHVQRMANQAVTTFLQELRRSLNLSRRRLTFPDRFLLKKRPFDLTDEEKTTLSTWKEKLPVLGEFYDLKEEFLRVWRCSDREKAEAAYSNWQKSLSPEMRVVFGDILNTIKNWHYEIFNYFDYKVTNAFTESANNLVKALQRQGPRQSFDTVRAKIIYRDYFKVL